MSQLVNDTLVEQVGEEQTIEVSNAEVAEAAKLVVGDEAVYQKFQADPVSRDFLDKVAKSAVTTIKLGGGTGVNDPQAQQQQHDGIAKVKAASKDIKISVAPRFGQWNDGAIDTSNWPGEYSGWNCSTGTSTASSAVARSRPKSRTAISERTL